jgi:hypothetical protein
LDCLTFFSIAIQDTAQQSNTVSGHDFRLLYHFKFILNTDFRKEQIATCHEQKSSAIKETTTDAINSHDIEDTGY